jgi:hypothetical protein
VACAFLDLINIPLSSIAHYIHTTYREPIPQAEFEARKQYWDNIIPDNGFNDRIVSELIRAKIPDTKYKKIFWIINLCDPIFKSGVFAFDGVYPGKSDAIKNDPQGGPYLVVLQVCPGQDFYASRVRGYENTDANIQAIYKDH